MKTTTNVEDSPKNTKNGEWRLEIERRRNAYIMKRILPGALKQYNGRTS